MSTVRLPATRKPTNARRRVMALEESFELLLSGDPSAEMMDIEAATQSRIAGIYPGANAWMSRAACRLVIGFVANMPELALKTVPAHQDILERYVWGAPRKQEEEEGFGAFWLFRGTNENLEAFEVSAIQTIASDFHLNPMRKLAARSWLRLQALYLDPSQIEDLLELWGEFRNAEQRLFEIPAWMIEDQSAIRLTSASVPDALH